MRPLSLLINIYKVARAALEIGTVSFVSISRRYTYAICITCEEHAL